MAVFALLYTVHLESIAKGQLQATYEVNLFNQQLGVTTALRRDFKELLRRIKFDLPVLRELPARSGTFLLFSGAADGRIAEQFNRYRPLFADIQEKSSAMELIFPTNLIQKMAGVVEFGNRITAIGEQFSRDIKAEEHPDRKKLYQRLVDDLQQAADKAVPFSQIFLDCTQEILSEGLVITKSRLQERCPSVEISTVK